ncbi:MAG: sortase [Rubrobacteraceae bacterium]
MAVSLLLLLAVVAVILLREPQEKAAVEPVAHPEPSEPLEPVDREIPSRESADLPVKPEPEPSPSPEPEPAAKLEPEPIPQPELEPEPESKPEPTPEPTPKEEPKARSQGALPLAEEPWPKPERSEVKAANEPRRYDWVRGAILTLTVDSMQIYNAPVMKTDSPQNLDKGVVHVPETSLPWTNSPHRNVYLAGHRLGWPRTGSRLIFYNLHRLSRGDEVLLKDRRGKRYRYRVAEKFVVNPDDRWVMGQELNRDMVTLQSCTGPYFSKRLVVRADRV